MDECPRVRLKRHLKQIAAHRPGDIQPPAGGSAEQAPRQTLGGWDRGTRGAEAEKRGETVAR